MKGPFIKDRKLNILKIVSIVLTAVLLGTLPCSAQGPNPDKPNCKWLAIFPELLGIEPDALPTAGQPVVYINATVTDPDRLHSLGLFGLNKGDKIKMLCMGADQWRIKHYATGLAIKFSMRPKTD